jgi:UDPglucose--hexose-1-phosphate uridylyltransferase
MFDKREHSHTRFNILTGDWVLVSPHRMKRPWQGKVETLPEDNRPSYDPSCYLCPGNKRSDGSLNPQYKDAYAFVNDFSALLPDTPAGGDDINGLLISKSETGNCKVICFSPDHRLTLPLMDEAAIVQLIHLWKKEFTELSQNEQIRYIQIFENKGDVMGCSNPHPHGQIWASSSLPLELSKETTQQKNYYEQHGKSLLRAYLELELQQQERIVLENEHFVALVPYWAVWPFETMIISKRHMQTILQFTAEEEVAFAEILKQLTAKYDNLFNVSFPYSAGMHQAPVNDGEHPEWHFHMHFYPPLLRSATVKKFMVGYEMLANPQRDITAEWAAEQLRELSTIHYKNA